MTMLQNEERLEDRARELEAKGLNGFRLAYVSLEPVAKPTFAWLDVEFWNTNDVSLAPPAAAFLVSGGPRTREGNPARPVAVSSVSVLTPNTLRLKIAPVGDYSTYILATTGAGLSAPGNALPLAMDPLLNALPFKFRPGCFNLNCAPDWDPPPAPPDEPSIDYNARDYDSFRHVLIAAMMRRVPNWAPTSEADLDQVLIDLIAADADEQADFHDRVMNERSIASARKRVSLARHARLMDYHIHQGNQASTWLALHVNGTVDVPDTSAGEFAVWTGRDWRELDAAIFAIPRAVPPAVRWRRRAFVSVNQLRLYTWRDTVTALAAGTTEADLTGAAALSLADAQALRDHFLGVHPDQVLAAGDEDVDAGVDCLLIEEALNPNTGAPNGRNIGRRQVLTLVPLGSTPPRAEIRQDPFTSEWFVRVRWIVADALKENYCFNVQCGNTLVHDVTMFHGNLARVTHGRPRITTFRAPGTPGLLANNESSLIATGDAEYEIVTRQDGAATPLRGVLCRLPRSPLAYRATPPGGERPTRTTLDVAVQGFADPWQEQSDLIESEGDDEHFIVETDEIGDSLVRFGDGTNGARVPAGASIACRYRVGQGVGGNVGADTLTAFDAAFGSVAEVWNPLDVADGLEPELAQEIVRRVPEAYRERQLRAVTLDDYAKRAEELPGVSHARAHYAWTGSWRTVRVAIDPVGTTRLEESLRLQIAEYLEAVRLIGEDLEVRPADYVPLDIKLRVCVHPQYWPEDVRAILEMELSDGWTPDGRRGFFHPDSWTFGQPLYVSQIIGRVLSVTGVDRVLRVSMRRWNPGSGGGTTSIDIDPSALPDALVDKLDIGPFEILIVANDPDHLETGRITLEITGGRR